MMRTTLIALAFILTCAATGAAQPIEPLEETQRRLANAHKRLERAQREMEAAKREFAELDEASRKAEASADKVDEQAQKFAKQESDIMGVIGAIAPWALTLLGAAGAGVGGTVAYQRRKRGQPQRGDPSPARDAGATAHPVPVPNMNDSNWPPSVMANGQPAQPNRGGAST